MPVVSLYIPDVPRKIRAALVREARSRNVSVNEVGAGILAARYKVPREPSDSGFVPVRSNERMVVRVPDKVRHKLRVQAARDDATISGLVKVAWAEALGLPAPSPKRKPREAA